MNMKIKDSIVWTAFLAVMAIIMFPSCSDEHEAGILEITNNEIILQAEGDPVQVEVKSNTEWRIDFVESTWFSTDIRGAQSSRTYFTVTYDENISDSERFCDIRVFTKDGKTSDFSTITRRSARCFGEKDTCSASIALSFVRRSTSPINQFAVFFAFP